MTHFLYILYSKAKDKYYIGETSDVNFRLNLHNSHSFKNSFTKIADDWIVVLQFECKDKNDALYLEAFTKRMKSKKFIQKIIDDQNILTDIVFKKQNSIVPWFSRSVGTGGTTFKTRNKIVTGFLFLIGILLL